MSEGGGRQCARLKVAGLVIGCCAKFVTGSVFVFSVYQGAIKDTFNYTQKEVEILSSMMNIGLGFGFLPGMFYDRFGPRWCSTLGLGVALSAHGLIWSTTRAPDFYAAHFWLMAAYFFLADVSLVLGPWAHLEHHPGFYAAHFWLMAGYFFLAGLGSVFMYMVALNTNGINFSRRNAGKVIGLLNAMFAGSQAVFPLIYYHLFTHGDITETGNQNFPGFFLMLIGCYAVVGLLCIFFLRIVVDEEGGVHYAPLVTETQVGYRTGGDVIIGNSEVKSETTSVDSSPEPSLHNHTRADSAEDRSEERLSVCQVLRNVDYQLILWMFGFASCIGLVYVNNITVISQSVHLDHYNDRLTIIIPISSSILSIAIGALSDKFRDRLPRTSLLLFACLAFCVSQVLVASMANVLAVLVIATVCVGFGLAVLWSITPTVMRENFSARNLGRNWGMAIFIAAFLNLGAQEAFGAIYDSQVTSELECYGMKCVRGGTLVLVALAAVSVIFAVAIQLKPRRAL